MTKRFICLLAVAVAMLFGGLNGTRAQGSQSARDACTPDAMRLCNEFVPDEAKVKSCMLSKRSQLSEACRLAMRASPARNERSERSERGERHHHHHCHHRHHCDD
jgi:hypothetical protein